MKNQKTLFIGLLISSAFICGLLLSGCEMNADGVGTLKLTNNSSERIVYMSLEKGEGGSTAMTSNTGVSAYSSFEFTNIETGSYTLFVTNSYGNRYKTKSSISIKKDTVTELKFTDNFERVY